MTLAAAGEKISQLTRSIQGNKGFTLKSSAAGEKIITIYTLYTRDLHWNQAPQARFFLQFTPVYTRDLHSILLCFWSPAGDFFNLHCKYKWFALFLKRRRRDFFCNLQGLIQRICIDFQAPQAIFLQFTPSGQGFTLIFVRRRPIFLWHFETSDAWNI